VPLQLQELESRLWSAANALRGPVDPADFKTYTFPMLFWKWIRDSWDYERARRWRVRQGCRARGRGGRPQVQPAHGQSTGGT